MYASNLIRVFCNRGFIISRPLISCHQCVKSKNYMSIANNSHRYELSIISQNLTSVLFSTCSSPDDNHNVSKEKLPKRRRRVISSSSSDENESSSPNKVADDVK